MLFKLLREKLANIHYKQLGETENQLRQDARDMRNAATAADIAADRVHRRRQKMFTHVMKVV